MAVTSTLCPLRTASFHSSYKYIYNLYVQYVVKNPLYTSGTPIRLEHTYSVNGSRFYLEGCLFRILYLQRRINKQCYC
ncbi:uncharacterized protein LOC109949529 isoform X4 [Prunus persica]|uniref:uncharacterized protein LOC109949529 isoform X4 n=1 Tax=Prunus persica TaxID=3760 RepID=UPI0009AB4863|nr:uncharacterized protein LOC109949529 isoform X4 [Prunus persica]